MYFFVPSIPLASSSALHPRVTPLRKRAQWFACEAKPDFGPAVSSGESLRKELQQIADERKAQADRTAEALEDMSKQLSKIMAQMRAEVGMPPVAEPPTDASPKPSTRVPDREAISEDESGSSSDEPYMDPQNFGYDSTAGWQVLAATDELPEGPGGNVEFRIECDMSGCSLIEIRGDSPPGPGVRQKFIQSGNGFRVGYDPEAPKGICGVVGSREWLIALNYDEIRHFKKLCLALQKKIERIGRGEEDAPMKKPTLRRSNDGMYNMRIAKAGLDCSVEFESKLVWVQAVGQPVAGQYCVRTIFMESRQSEGFWSMETAPGLFAALNKLGID